MRRTWIPLAAVAVVVLGAPAGPVVGRAAARDATPWSEPGTPVGTGDTRFEVAFPAPVLPAGPVYAWSTLYAVDPGVSTAYPGFEIESPVAALVWVQAGTMAIGREHVAVHHGSAAAPGASPAAGALLLGPGDTVGLDLGPGHSYWLRSAGPGPLVFAEFWLVGGPRPLYRWQPEYRILDHHNLASAATLASPTTVTMRLARSTLAPGATLEPAEGDWQLALTEGGVVSRQILSGAAQNNTQAPITVVAMTAEFRPAAATSAASGA